MNRKGITLDFLVIMIIVVVSFMLIAMVIRYFTTQADEKELEILCHDSVALRVATSFSVGGADVKAAPLLCKTIDRKVSGGREEIKSEIAYLMSRCWWMFNEGRQDVLESEGVAEMLGWEDSGNSCFLCYNVLIDEKEIEGDTIGAPEMFRYMLNTDHRQIKGMKYVDYIQSYGGPGKVSMMNGIDAQNAYGIVYMSKNDDDSSLTVFDGIVTSLAAVGAVVCAIAEPCGVLAAGAAIAGTTYVGVHGAQILAQKAKFYEQERSVSMVVLDDLKAIQAGDCLVKDLAEG